MYTFLLQLVVFLGATNAMAMAKNNDDQQSSILKSRAIALINQNYFADAAEYYYAAARQFEALPNIPEAIDCYERAASAFILAGNSTMSSEISCLVGFIQTLQGNFKLGLPHFKLAIANAPDRSAMVEKILRPLRREQVDEIRAYLNAFEAREPNSEN